MKRLFILIIIISIFMSIILLSSCTATNFTETNKSTEKESEEIMSDTVETKESVENSSDTEKGQTEKHTNIPKTITKEDLVEIYEIREQAVDSSGRVRNNIISDTDIKVENPKAADIKSVRINGIDYDITYIDSRIEFYSDDVPYDRYVLEDKGTIDLKSGELSGIYYAYTKIDMNSVSANGGILKSVKNELSKTFDMSQYNEEYFETLFVSGGALPDTHYAYFYKIVNGYCVKYLTATINENGEIYNVEVLGFQSDFEQVKIDSELEKAALELKFKDTYGDSYQSYAYAKVARSSTWRGLLTPSLISYQGRIYVCYKPVITCLENSFNDEFIVPLDMISNN